MITHRDIKDVSYLNTASVKKHQSITSNDLFWPFYLWRVSAPKENRPLNIFQMLILKLIRTNCTSFDKLCLYSNLDKELIRYIVSQLINDGYLDDWRLTEKGSSILNGNVDNDSTEKRSYYLIQDATSNTLIPRALNTLSFIENIDLSSSYPKFVKNRGTGKSISPYLIRDTKTVLQPNAEQMSQCMRSYRRTKNELTQANIYIPEATIENSQSIDFIENTPIYAFIHLKLFSINNAERQWYISDPSGLTASVSELNIAAEILAAKNKDFAKRINKVLGIDEEGKVVSYNEQQKKFEEQVNIQVLSQYSWAQTYPTVERHIKGMLRVKMQVTSDAKPNFELIDSLLSEQQRVLEAWLKELIAPNRNNEEWKIFVKGRHADGKTRFENDRALLKEIYKRVDGVTDEVAYQLATVAPGRIQNALQYGEQSLKALLAAALLKAPNTIESITKEYPSWLEKVIVLANDRNEYSSHAGKKAIEKEIVLEHLASVEVLLAVIEQFIGSK